MTKNNTIAKIEKIKTKIDENTKDASKKLSQDEVQEFLIEIDNDLTEIKKNVDKEQQEVIKGLKEKIGESAENEDA
jgi:hypothetical protein